MSKNVRLGDPKRAICYLRVSTSRQELSPHAQANAAEQWAQANGVEIVAMFFDKGVSGGQDVGRRACLMGALSSLRPLDVGVIIVAKRDRLARDMMITATIERLAAEEGAHIVSAAGEGNGSLPADKFMRQILDAVAELERATIQARTVMALAAKRDRNEPSKPRKPRSPNKRPRLVPPVAPYGLRIEFGRLVPAPEEQAVLEAARVLHGQGFSMARIASTLESRGMLNRKGNPFIREQVWKMLQNPAALAA